MNSRRREALEKAVAKAKEREVSADRAYRSAHDQMYPEEKAERDWVERQEAGEDDEEFDILGHLLHEHKKATAERVAAEAQLQQEVHAGRLHTSKRGLEEAASADDVARDKHAHLIRVRINQTGAAIIATSVGILVVRTVRRLPKTCSWERFMPPPTLVLYSSSNGYSVCFGRM